jgi:hypothetical protein
MLYKMIETRSTCTKERPKGPEYRIGNARWQRKRYRDSIRNACQETADNSGYYPFFCKPQRIVHNSLLVPKFIILVTKFK